MEELTNPKKERIIMAEERSKVCRYCGIVAPQGHWRPYTWIEKHEANCPKNPTCQALG